MSYSFRRALLRRRAAGFTLTEILISIALLAIISVSVTQAFLVLNRTSARSRVGTAALVMAQQEIDQVMSVRPYTSSLNVPQILRVQSEGGTLAAGESWANATTAIRPVDLLVVNMQGTTLVKGMLTRKVTVVNSSLRQVDVTVGYNFRGGTNAATYTYSTSTQFDTDYKYKMRSSTFRSPDE